MVGNNYLENLKLLGYAHCDTLKLQVVHTRRMCVSEAFWLLMYTEFPSWNSILAYCYIGLEFYEAKNIILLKTIIAFHSLIK